MKDQNNKGNINNRLCETRIEREGEVGKQIGGRRERGGETNRWQERERGRKIEGREMKRETEKGEREAERGRRRNEWLEIERDRKRGGWPHSLIMLSLRQTWDLKKSRQA